MDARITKSRLANFLAYDWLKILLAVAAVVAVLSVFFTTVRTRPKGEQEYSLFAYSDLSMGEDAALLGDDLYEKGTFSYDVLLVNAESFSSNMYAGAAFTARRSAGEGNAMFIGNAVLEEGEDAKSMLRQFVEGYLVQDGGQKTLKILLDVKAYMAEADAYLAQYYGENWREEGATLDEEKAAACFLARNGKDKRYKTEAKKAQGIEDEKKRFSKLRSDLLTVEAAFESGVLSYTTITTEDGDFTVGIRLGRLPGLTDLYYYTDAAGNKSAEELNLVLFNNGDEMGDLKFETVSLLRYLLKEYA